MLFDYGSLLLAVSMGCVATSLTLMVSWLANRRDTFLLMWASTALVLMLGTAAYGFYIEYPERIAPVIGSSLILCGLSLCWCAARLFRKGRAPVRTSIVLAACLVALQAVFYFPGQLVMMFVVMNASATAILAVTAREYWLARHEHLQSLIWLAALYALVAASFVPCIVVALVHGPLTGTQVLHNWSETLNAVVSIIGVTGIGALSLAINQERLARDHHRDARTDPLTGLLNRRAFDDVFKAEPVPASTAVVVFDLDHFKAINDSHGHAIGDSVLQYFADVCKRCTRAQDVVARLGGEEFAVVLTECTRARALGIAERICDRFARIDTEHDRTDIRCTVSAGLHISSGGETIYDMLCAADIALYRAKDSGRNRVVSSAGMDDDPRLSAIA